MRKIYHDSGSSKTGGLVQGDPMRLTRNNRLPKSIAFTVFAVGLTASQALAGARPAAVPAEYVVTPFGYFHPSCVQHLAKGDVLRQDENTVERADGTFQNIYECAYPHYEADGTRVVGGVRATGDGKTQRPYIGHCWIE